MRRIILAFALFGVMAATVIGAAVALFSATPAFAQGPANGWYGGYLVDANGNAVVPALLRSGAPGLRPLILQSPAGTTMPDGVRLQAADEPAPPSDSYYGAFGNQPLSYGQADLSAGYSQAWECTTFGHGC